MTGSWPLETPLLLVGVRCITRYIVLPAVLPLLGVVTGATQSIATAAALGMFLLLDMIAVASIVITLRRLWLHRHPRRWQYLPLALTLTRARRLLPGERHIDGVRLSAHVPSRVQQPRL